MDQKKIDKFPLVHGGNYLKNNLDSICNDGLLPQKSSNITPIDVAVGKDKCVFLRVSRVYANYGSGELLIVNPEVSNKTGVIFYSRDLQGIGHEIKRFLSNPNYQLENFVTNQDILIKITHPYRKILSSLSDNLSEQKLRNKLYNKFEKSKEFTDYLNLYSKTKDELYKILLEKYESNQCSLFDFFTRAPYSKNWLINEEICIPNRIEPEYLLGFWDKVQYTYFGSSCSSETKEILDVFIETLRNESLKKSKE